MIEVPKAYLYGWLLGAATGGRVVGVLVTVCLYSLLGWLYQWIDESFIRGTGEE